jgi:two-component system phosphate regulon sensor histidine kinase PhoR
MKRVLFKRILLFYLIVTPLLVIVLELYLSNVIKKNYIEKLKGSLVSQARLIADRIPFSQDNLDDFCRRFKDKTGARVTIIDSSGRVQGDSDEPSAQMENHADRPEIRDADISEVGSSTRFSNTIKRDLFYLAIPIDGDAGKGFIRLSVPLEDVETAVNKIRMRIIIGSLVALFIVILIGLLQTRRITKSIEDITSFSQDVAAGNFRRRLFLEEKGELGELGKNIGNMAQELDNRLKQREREKTVIEAILNNMTDGLILTDTKGRIVLSNAAIKNFFSIDSSIEGKTLIEVFRKAELIEVIDGVVEGKEKISREVEVTYPKELYIMVNASPFYSDDKGEEISGVILTIHDITRLKKLEDIRKDFVANVSHEIRTPIAAIKGFSETLLEGALDDRENAQRFLETIRNHSERLNSLVSDLLTLSRIELGDITLDKKGVNLDSVVDTVFATLKEKAEKKGLYLKKDISDGAQEIMADRDRLIQILLNLVDNGIKFTEEGGVTVKAQSSRPSPHTGGFAEENESPEETKSKIQNHEDKNPSLVTTHQPSGDFFEILIEDTGIGIPKKHLSRLGERFYRVDRARSRDLGGTGLGLAIVKHLIKAHGWEMEIESTEEKGTTVRLILPEN